MSPEITHIRVNVPDAIQGHVLGKLNRLGGQITMVQQAGDSRTALSSTIPKQHVEDFKIWLDTFSGGLGSFAEDAI